MLEQPDGQRKQTLGSVQSFMLLLPALPAEDVLDLLTKRRKRNLTPPSLIL